MAQTAETRTTVSLEDKYALESGRVFLNGTQALVRLPMMQRQRDAAAGLNTAAYVTGYRGSPLGALDQQMERAKRFLERNNIVFRAGVNEDLAATAIGGPSRSTCRKVPSSMGCSASGTAKGPGSTVRATCSAMQIWPAHPRWAVFWPSPATTTPANHRRCRARANTPSPT